MKIEGKHKQINENDKMSCGSHHPTTITTTNNDELRKKKDEIMI